MDLAAEDKREVSSLFIWVSCDIDWVEEVEEGRVMNWVEQEIVGSKRWAGLHFFSICFCFSFLKQKLKRGLMT